MTTELLRLATAGSVDDGKSTLIGRLLWDSKSVFEDQAAAVEDASARRGEATNLALLTDGLRAEREQGITIDVAYRYFATPRRKFIVADTPGHVQYTRNMVTGASTADLAVILVDARKGLVEQSFRHAYLSTLLRVPHLVLAVNKMDLVGWDEGVFRAIAEAFPFEATAIPLSALNGDNVVTRSDSAPWYDGPSLLEHLESVDVATSHHLGDARFPVQYVVRDHRTDYRGYAGQVASGVLHAGDEVEILPSGVRTTIASIDTYDGPVDEAFAPMSVTIRLADEVDVSRGDMVVGIGGRPTVTQDLEATVCWMTDEPLRPGSRYLVKHTTRTAKAVVRTADERLDVTTLRRVPSDGLGLNDIGRVTLRTAQPLFADDYAENRATGSFILIDELTGATAGAGLIGARA
ncbi:MAG TPA: GTP-binding protein [Frankiaceae bacterium]|jgi:bifunctional enzyme CysN/CysC|nr:GTP-binding protein [Frankiaceae bacterium]